MTRFLSKENFEYVFKITKQYLEDGKQIHIDDQVNFQKLVATEMKKLGQDSAGASIEMLNKKAIVAVRDAFLGRADTAPIQPPPPLPIEEEPPKDNSEDAFFKKLKDLEFQRSVSIATSSPPPVVVKPAEEPPNTPAPAQLPPSTIIINKAVAADSVDAKNCVTIMLNSWARLWQYQTDRSCFIPDFELRPDVDNNSVKLERIILPNVATITDWIPFYVFHLEGAGKQTQEIVAYPVYKDATAKWIHLEPASANSIKPFATPWIITLKDAYGSQLALGHDGWVVTKVIRTQRGTCVLALQSPSGDSELTAGVMRDFDVGDTIIVRNTNDDSSVTTRIVQTTAGTVEVAHQVPETNYTLVVMNLNRQITCILGAVKQ